MTDNNYDYPVSIEEFAAYLDGNLSDDEMQRISSTIENDETMHDIAASNESVNESLLNCEPLELVLPEELTSIDFEIPTFDNEFNIENDLEYMKMTECTIYTAHDDPGIDNDDYKKTNDITHTGLTDNTTNHINDDFTQEHGDFLNNIHEINE